MPYEVSSSENLTNGRSFGSMMFERSKKLNDTYCVRCRLSAVRFASYLNSNVLDRRVILVANTDVRASAYPLVENIA